VNAIMAIDECVFIIKHPPVILEVAGSEAPSTDGPHGHQQGFENDETDHDGENRTAEGDVDVMPSVILWLMLREGISRAGWNLLLRLAEQRREECAHSHSVRVGVCVRCAMIREKVVVGSKPEKLDVLPVTMAVEFLRM